MKEITEVGEWITGKGDEEVDGREWGQAVYQVVARAKRDPELDGHEQRLSGYIIDPSKHSSHPLTSIIYMASAKALL